MQSIISFQGVNTIQQVYNIFKRLNNMEAIWKVI